MVEMEKDSGLDTDDNKLSIDELDYEEEIFTIITDENYEEIVPDFCKSIFKNSVFESSNTRNDVIDNYMLDLNKLLKQLPRPYTIVQEFYHIDPSFRDTYYTYFSNQHFQIKTINEQI